MTQLILSRAENNILHSILQYSITSFAEFSVQPLQVFKKASILLIYRSNNFKVQDIGQITHLITLHKPGLVSGDFNINTLRDLPFLDTMRQYGHTLSGTEPTNIMGGLLDHLYIQNNEKCFGKLTLQTQPVHYYPEHDAIILNWLF